MPDEVGFALGNALSAGLGEWNSSLARKFQEKQAQAAIEAAKRKDETERMLGLVRDNTQRYTADQRLRGTRETNDTNLQREDVRGGYGLQRTDATNNTNINRTLLGTLSNQLIAQGHDATSVKNAVTGANARLGAANIGANAQRDVSGNNLSSSMLRTLATVYDTLHRPQTSAAAQLQQFLDGETPTASATPTAAPTPGSGSTKAGASTPDFMQFVQQHMPGMVDAASRVRPPFALTPRSAAGGGSPSPAGSRPSVTDLSPGMALMPNAGPRGLRNTAGASATPSGAPPAGSVTMPASPRDDEGDDSPSGGYVNPEIAGARAEMEHTPRGPAVTVSGTKNPRMATKVGGDALRALAATGVHPVASHGATVAPSSHAGGPQRVGDMKTFPNGRRGQWDGQGWVAVDQPPQD